MPQQKVKIMSQDERPDCDFSGCKNHSVANYQPTERKWNIDIAGEFEEDVDFGANQQTGEAGLSLCDKHAKQYENGDIDKEDIGAEI